MIHKPTFSSSLSHNRVPSHLLLAVCALAAPLSKQPRIRTTPARFAGKPFAQEALSQMFDGAGRLVVEPDLAAAQALCVLQMHDILTKERDMVWSSRFHGAISPPSHLEISLIGRSRPCPSNRRGPRSTQSRAPDPNAGPISRICARGY